MSQSNIFFLTLCLYIAAMVGAYLLARWLTGLARRAGLRWGVLSPVTGRSSHTVPTPRTGGIGLALGFGLTAGAFLLALWYLPHQGAALGYNPWLVGWLGLGWGLMLAVGLLDDFRDLPPLAKLGLEVAGALAPALGGGILFVAANYTNLPTGANYTLNVALTALWILFFTNGFNFMDGMDGFAAGFARLAAVALFLIPLASGLRFGSPQYLRGEAYLLPLLAMACWGFLEWNRPPARVFMGDGGSLSVGYLLAVYPVLGQRDALGLPLPFVSSLTILLPFLFDVTLTLIRRARRGENLLKAHREHLYQRLLKTGLSHAEVLRMNLWRFGLCAGAALIGALTEPAGWLGRAPAPIRTVIDGKAVVLAPPAAAAGWTTDVPWWSWLWAGVALLVMLDYWRQVLRRERRMVKS